MTYEIDFDKYTKSYGLDNIHQAYDEYEFSSLLASSFYYAYPMWF